MAVDIIARGMAGNAGGKADDLDKRVTALENDPGITVDTQVNSTSTNPVENKAIYSFVNSSVSTNTANFIDTFDSVEELESYSGTVTNNDYAFVVGTDSEGNVIYSRYKYQGDTGAWAFEYTLSNSEFTASQWATINSGLTAGDKEKLTGIEAGANKTIVDNALSETSENPVQNKVITEALDLKYDKTYDVQLTQEEYDALGAEKYFDGKNYYVPDAGEEPIEPVIIYGWKVDPSESDPYTAVSYLEDAVNMTPASMGATAFNYGSWKDAFFMPKPCMLRSDGTVDYYLDPNDYTKKADGTASDVANPDYDGNAMMEWPLIWWKYEAGETEGEGYFYVSNRKVDDSFNCWCNYNCDDKIVSHFYTAIYNGTGTDKMRSISGIALTSANGNGSTTATQEITRATANNTTNKTEWYIDVWSDRMLINGLLILMGKSLNSQAVFGRGLDTGSQSAKEAYVTGSLNDKGLFWGNTSAGTSGVKVFGMENYWGCVWHRTAGLIGLSNGNTAYKLTYGTADGTTADGYNTNGNGYLVDTTARPANGYFKTAKFGKFGYLPLTTGSSSTTYYSDYWYTNNSALTFALVGGSAAGGVGGGCSCFYLATAPGYAYWNISSSLSFKPLV